VFRELIERNIRKLAITGNSISVQPAKAFACDLLRAGYNFAVEKGKRFFSEHKLASANIIYNSSHSLKLIFQKGQL
jgi:hypothetical protein